MAVAIPAASAVFLFEGGVVATIGESTDGAIPFDPPLDTPADVSLTIFDDHPSAAIADRLAASGPVASVMVEIPDDPVGVTDLFSADGGFVGSAGLGFPGAASATILAGPVPDPLATGSLSFDGFFDTPIETAPVTVGNLVAALSSDPLSGSYRFGPGGGGTAVAFADKEPVPAVPLPPAGLALLGGLGLLGFAGARRR
ncbi:hypothetical protein [uncultured Jannaschia sp.]|uniref:hypothetical protein n=1 Tax=uncultured Jannaschia sp. TaxID=293347 RepID=UPI002614759D|nr:hypothetical protein [uncultured Jannaschia sp.]